MGEIVSLFQEADKAEVEKTRRLEEEAAKIEEVRRAFLESFRENKERKNDNKPCLKKKRTSGADSIAFIKENVELEAN